MMDGGSYSSPGAVNPALHLQSSMMTAAALAASNATRRALEADEYDDDLRSNASGHTNTTYGNGGSSSMAAGEDEPLLRRRQQREVSASMFSLALQDEPWIFTPPVSPASRQRTVRRGAYRYLKGADLDEGVCYDFAIVIKREKKKKKTHTDLESPEKDGIQLTMLEKLTDNGLDVDVIEGDFTRMVKGDTNGRSKYIVLLVRGKHEVLAAYGRKLKFQTWLRSGNTREVESAVRSDPIVSPADRIQVIDHIIREGAKIRETDAHVHSIFPVHDETVNEYLLTTFIQTRKLEHLSESFLSKVKEHFGEKVAFYFAYADFYNKSLVPIAVLGVLLTCFRGWMGTPVYMRFMVVWAFLVSVVWSFWFLKSWTRRNSELNFQWENNLETTEINYKNPNFKGDVVVNPITGLPDQYYPSWKRYPKYCVVVLFMLLQISIMMLIIACWITVFEVLKVRYPTSGIFSAQWFYILGGGILYGVFVDVFQWNLIVTKAARLFSEWENWKTLEQFEKAMVRKLFLMDFLNYYTWFFLLAFVYVLPGAGDTITNFLNSVIWKDPANCCFGPYLDRSGTECRFCPPSWHALVTSESRCVPCRGWVTFDVNHLDLEQLFLTPIVVTQALNLAIAVMVPWIHRQHHEQRLRSTDKKAMELVKKQGARQIIADMAYRDDDAQLTNLSKARFLENDELQIEKLNAKAHDILFQSDQDDYDPYDDYHNSTVQFGFVVMFSTLWPLMPMVCMVVNALKMRGDGFRLCRTLKRPFPRKASGIGEWYGVLHFLACTGVIVNVGLVFISTGAMDFLSASCSAQISSAMGGDFSKFKFGPDFACFSLTARMVMILVTEHAIFGGIWMFWKLRKSVPERVELEMRKREYKFKTKMYDKTVRKWHERLQSKAGTGATMATPAKPQRRTASAPGAHSSGGPGMVPSLISINLRKADLKAGSVSTASTTTTATTASSSGVSGGSNPTTPVRRRAAAELRDNGDAGATTAERVPLLSSRSLAQAWEAARSSSSLSDKHSL